MDGPTYSDKLDKCLISFHVSLKAPWGNSLLPKTETPTSEVRPAGPAAPPTLRRADAALPPSPPR